MPNSQSPDDQPPSPSSAALAAGYPRVGQSALSNSRAASEGLWDVLDTVHCGKPEVVHAFLSGVAPQLDILDVGCWSGSIAQLALEACPGAGSSAPPWRSYRGIDLVPESVARFNQRFTAIGRTEALLGDIRALPMPDDTVDVVICLFVLQDMEGGRADGIHALRELRRVSRHGARALIGLTVHQDRDEQIPYVVRRLRPAGIPAKPTHHWALDDYRGTLRRLGFAFGQQDWTAFGPNDRGFVEVYVSATIDKESGSP